MYSMRIAPNTRLEYARSARRTSALLRAAPAAQPSRYREKEGEKDEQTPRRLKRHERWKDIMDFIYRPLSSTAQGASNVSNS